ncbi:tyrosine-type recombinase/integrase [Candidatus Dependentiae bacterium]|nr:tyrosine-type recombinase/integrase [Candidatus Dependentiae bacterium]
MDVSKKICYNNTDMKRRYKGVSPDRYNKGKWEYRIYQGRKEIQKGGFESQLAASKARELKLAELAAQNKPAVEKSLQFKDWVLYWYENYSKRYKRSHEDDLHKINKDILPILGEFYLDKLELEQGYDYINKIKKRGLKEATLNRHISLLKKICNDAIRQKKIIVSPFRYLNKFDVDNRRDNVYSDEEIEQIFNFMPAFIKEFVFFLLSVGTRPTATGLIQWNDINFAENKVKMVYENAKGKRTEYCYFDDRIKEMLQMIKERKTHPDYVFVYKNKTGKFVPISLNTWTGYWKKFKEKTGIDGWFYDLKRTFATNCSDIGIPIETIKELLHHKDINTTMRYIGKKEDRKKDAIIKLSEFNNRKIIGKFNLKNDLTPDLSVI